MTPAERVDRLRAMAVLRAMFPRRAVAVVLVDPARIDRDGVDDAVELLLMPEIDLGLSPALLSEVGSELALRLSELARTGGA